MLRDLILRTRSYRRFHQHVAIDMETLRELVDLARLSASGSNLQPLKFMLSCDPETNALIFPLLGFAGYLKDWLGPEEGERPAAYIVILGDKELRPSFGIDHGIAAQSMLLGATEKGFGGCIFGSVKRAKLREIFEIPPHIEVLHVVALGKPKETVQLDAVGSDGDIKYWRDAAGVHHVPKRALDDIIFGG